MEKLNNSNLELLKNIFKEISFDYDETKADAKDELFKSWEDIIGNKISKMSKMYDISEDNILTIACSDSFVANELYFEKEKIMLLIVEKAQKLGIKIKDIKFNYKIWKENNL